MAFLMLVSARCIANNNFSSAIKFLTHVASLRYFFSSLGFLSTPLKYSSIELSIAEWNTYSVLFFLTINRSIADSTLAIKGLTTLYDSFSVIFPAWKYSNALSI